MKSIACLIAACLATAAAAKVTDADLKRDTQALSADAFEGRKPGTPGAGKAVDYIVERMRQIGLKPGNDGKWTQDVPLVTITASPGRALTVTGKGGAMTFAQDIDAVLWTKRQVATVAVDASPMVFVGYGIVAPERGWNDYAGLDVRGKTVVILVNDPDWQTTAAGKDAGPFEGRAMTWYGRWIYKFEEAARQGATGAIIIHQTEPAAYPWGVVAGSNSGKIDLDTPAESLKRTVVEGWITEAAARRMLAATGQDLDALTRVAQARGFRAVPLDLTASTRFTNTLVHSTSPNVIGILPGTKRPDEVVLYTAHWDHLGRCPADANADDICNGALDNASGVAGLLTLAGDAVKRPRTARSQVFMAVTAEESGLLGSQYYAEHPVYPLGKTVGGVNMDVLNVNGRTRDVVLIGAGKSELEPLFVTLAARQGRRVSPEPSPEKGGYYRSDHFSFAKLGVPMLSARSGIDLVEGGSAAGQAAADDYTVNRYHKATDNYNPAWNWSGAVDDLQAYADLGNELATGTAWPNWTPGAEFRAARDASRAAVK